jgi:hypothetical protein
MYILATVNMSMRKKLIFWQRFNAFDKSAIKLLTNRHIGNYDYDREA